jgi:serpin B
MAEPAAAAALPAGFVEANTAFAQRLYGKLSGTQGNVFFSPASISTALGMAYAGARGQTEAEMAKTLEFRLPQAELHPAFAALTARIVGGTAGGPEIRIANRLWGQAGMPVEADFKKLTEANYGAGLELLDFKTSAEPSRARINQWVDEQTKGKIKDLLPTGSINPLTRLVLANAIYFKGLWATPFDKANTKPEPFRLQSKSSVTAQMMRKILSAPYAETADAQVLALGYRAPSADRAMSMIVILPKAVDGLPKVEEAIAAGRLAGYVAPLALTQVDVALPRFKITSEQNLNTTLAAMGMPLAFDDKKADFSGITKAERLYITRVQHKAFVEVNEEGTEAAAATGVVMGTRSLPPPPKVFRADRPFFFLIRDDGTGAVLFMGRVANPA